MNFVKSNSRGGGDSFSAYILRRSTGDTPGILGLGNIRPSKYSIIFKVDQLAFKPLATSFSKRTYIKCCPHNISIRTQAVNFWGWNIHPLQRFYYLIFSFNCVCCFAQELSRRLFPEHITVFVGGDEKVGWVGLAISKLRSVLVYTVACNGRLILYLENLNRSPYFRDIRLDVPLK